jgi:hypothetical protein
MNHRRRRISMAMTGRRAPAGGLLLLRLPSGEDGGKMRVSFVEIEVF